MMIVRLFRAVTHFFRVRTAGFAPAGGWLIYVLKGLPATVAGVLLFVYVYGPAYHRYRGTFVAARAWYRALGHRPRPRWVRSTRPSTAWDPTSAGPLRPGRSRPGWVFRPAEVDLELYHREVYSLDSAFPVPGDEPFQEYNQEYFDAQQDLDTFQDDEPHEEIDLTWGTREPIFGVEESPEYERDRFRRLDRRDAADKQDYYLLDEPVDGWVVRADRGGLSRLVSPGDGPAVEDDEDPDHGLSEWDGLVDWHHYRTSPGRISELPPVWGDFSYLFYEHRQVYRPDPIGRPAGWYRSGRGLVPWLYRTRRRRWGRIRWRILRYYQIVHGAPNGAWQTRRRRRHLRHPGHWMDLRWRRPGLTLGALALDLFGGPPGRRGLDRRVSRFAARAVRFVRSGFVWRRRRRPAGRPAPHVWCDRPRRDPRSNQLVRGAIARPTGVGGRGRPRIAGWHAPRYLPAYDRNRRVTDGLPGHPGGLPPTGVEWVVWLFGGWLAFNVVFAVGVTYVCYFLRVGTDPHHPVDFLGLMDDPAWRSDSFRRVAPGLLDALDVRREPTPRERVTTKAYSLWTTPIGRDWRDNPGLDPGLLAGYVADALRPLLGYETWWFTALNEQMLIFNKRIGVDRRGIFFWYAGWRLPSWVHMDDRIGDEWVHDPMFRLYHGQLEPFTYRREMDHRYNSYGALGWKINDQFLESEIEDNFDELLNQLWHYYRGDGVRRLLAQPEWIVPGRGRRFHLDYAGYWSSLVHHVVWPSAVHLDVWSATYDLGLSDAYDWVHRRAVLTSDGHYLFAVPTRWEPHLNAELLRRWNEPPVFPYTDTGLRPTALVAWIERTARAAWSEATPVVAEAARTWLYLGGFLYLFFFRWFYLVGLTRPGVTPVVPVTRAAAARRGTIFPGGWRRPRPNAPARDVPRWSRVTPGRTSWRWNRELHWADFHRGRHTEVFRRPGRPGRPGRTAPAGAGRHHPGRPTTPAGVVGLLYQSARAGPRGGRHRAGRAVRPGRPIPAGWLVRPRWYAAALPDEYRSEERPGLVRPGRPRRDRRVHPDGVRPHRHRPGVTADPVELPPGLPTGVSWSYRGHSIARTVQHAWHRQRYRTTLAGVNSAVPVPADPAAAAAAGLAGVDYPGRTAHLGEAPTDNGYDPSGVNDEEGDDFVAAGNNHHEDVEDFDEPHDPDDEYEGVRYLSVDPAVGVTPGWGDSFVRRRLRSYERFGGLPLGGYRPPALADYFDDHTAAGWSAASADHPVWLAAQLTYHGVARWGRHLHRGVTPVGAVLTRRRRRRRRRRGRSPRPGGLVYSAGWDPLWDELGQTGWYVFELDDTDYRFDDLDVVEYGRPDEARRTVSGGYHAARYRPGAVAAAAGAVWAPPAGWNTWRYVVAEGDDPGRDDPEGYFLECLSRTYLDHYDEHYFVADLEMFIDRDYDDLHEGAPIEEENQEVPRTRPSDYPGWLVAAAVAGASAGDVTQPGRSARLAGDDVDVEAAVVAYRPGRAELRRYYRASRDARGRVARTRPPRLTAPDYGELGELADELGLERDVDPAPAEVDAFGPAEIVGLEGDDWTDESLRLWALTEVYWGDLPQGSANTH